MTKRAIGSTLGQITITAKIDECLQTGKGVICLHI